MAAPALIIGRRPGTQPIGLHIPSTLGPVYQSVVSPFGERFSTDELHHRVVVERGGERCAFGRPGTGAGNFCFPRGIGLVPGRSRGTSRLFVCDAWNDRVQVFDGHGVFVFAFGGRGNGPGLFNAPSGLAIVTPVLPGDEEIPVCDRESMLAVADRENHRIQVFALDGTLVSVIGEGDGMAAPAVPADQRRGWPRSSGGRIVLRYPSSLSVRSRQLAVTCAGGDVLEIDLAAAMLPAEAAAELVWRARRRPANLRLVSSGGVRCAS